MFFILSKTVAFLFLPSNILILMGLAGLALMLTPARRAGRRLLVASFILLLVAGFSPAGRWLGGVLENRFPPFDPARGAPDGIVVLGGAIVPGFSRAGGEPVLGEGAGRVIAISHLAREYPSARIVYSGGDPSLSGDGRPEATMLGPMLDSFGIPRSRVLLEARSRNTAENAAFTKDMVEPKPNERWLLVTSAQHMPRAIGCFRRVGFNVEAYPVDWRTPPRFNLLPSAWFADGLLRTDAAIHEWAGLVAYWLTGRTSELLPAPRAAP